MAGRTLEGWGATEMRALRPSKVDAYDCYHYIFLLLASMIIKMMQCKQVSAKVSEENQGAYWRGLSDQESWFLQPDALHVAHPVALKHWKNLANYPKLTNRAAYTSATVSWLFQCLCGLCSWILGYRRPNKAEVVGELMFSPQTWSG